MRYYVGYDNPFRVWGMQGLTQGWHVIGQLGQTNIEATIDLGNLRSGMGIYIELQTIAYTRTAATSFADFGHTLRFEWDLPEGVVATSASGRFLTAPIPEPQTWALMLGGLALVGRVARRRLAALALV